MAQNYGFTREEALAELKRRGVDTSEFERPMDYSPGDQPADPLTPGAESRTRITLGLGPSINAQRNIFSAEGWNPKKPKGGGENVLDKHPVANFFTNMDIPIPFTGGAGGQSASWSPFRALANKWGGQDFQDYSQAAKSFETAFMPILSGQAVSASEAQRMIRANLPEYGDTRETLARKATNRAMMINGAADLMGKDRPFPKVGTMDLLGTKPGSQPHAGQSRAANTGPPPPKPGDIVKGYRFKGGNPGDRNAWEPA